MEMDEHRAQRQKVEARIAELERQLLDYAKKIRRAQVRQLKCDHRRTSAT